MLRNRDEIEDNDADWVGGNAYSSPAEKDWWPVKKENVAESLRCKADENRGEGA